MRNLKTKLKKKSGVKCEITLTYDTGEENIHPEEWRIGDIVVCQRTFYHFVKDRKYIINRVNGDLVRVEDCIDGLFLREINKEHFKFHSRPA